MLNFNNTDKAVLRSISLYGPLSKSELCEITSYSWAGISKSVSRLLERGILEKLSPDKSSEAGRPCTRIDINSTLLFGGISISYSKVQVVIVNWKGDIIDSGSKILSRDDDPVPEAVRILEHIFTPEIKNRFISLGISFPGIVDSSKTTVKSSVYFSDFFNRKIVEEFEIALQMDIPILVERNAVCELYATTKEQNLNTDSLLISLNSGVTGALLLDGKILNGKTGKLALLGHTVDTDSKIPCLCGKAGCLDTVVGEVTWIREFRRISKLPGANGSFYKAIEKGMPQAVKMLRHSLQELLPVLNPLLLLFEPDNLIFSADLPPCASLVYSTFIEQNKLTHVSNIIIADHMAATKGAAIIGFLNNFYKLD